MGVAPWLLAGALLAAVTAAVAPAGLAAQAHKTEKARGLLLEAHEAMKAGDFPLGLKKLNKAEKAAGGSSAETLVLKTRCLYQLGRYDEAVEQADAALALEHPPQRRAAALNLRALSRFDQLQLEEQEWMRVGARTQVPMDKERLREERKHKREQALERIGEDLREGLDLAGDSANALRYNLAQVLYRQGEREEARDLLAAYLETGPSAGTQEAAESMKCLLDHQVDKDGVYRLSPLAEGAEAAEGITPPERLRAPPPRYTERARQARVQGIVILQTVIGEDGRIDCVWPLIGLPMGLTEATVESVRRWEFEPARKDGEPVKVFYNLTVNFTLR